MSSGPERSGSAGPPAASPPDPLLALTKGAVSGDPSATRALLLAISRPVRGVCRTVLGSGHPELEDTVQESHVAVIKALPAYRFAGDFIHYALRIAVRTALAARRRAHGARTREETMESAQDELAAEGSTPAQRTLAAEQRELLRQALDELPEAQAQALVLRAIFDLSIDQIARGSGVSVNTVKTRLRLAKDSLRRLIAADGRLTDALGDEF